MSQQEPTRAYIYQPGGVGERIWGVSGPGTECRTGLGAKGGWSFQQYRFTKAEAEAVVEYCNNGKTESPREIRAAFLKAISFMFEATNPGRKKKKRKAAQKDAPIFNCIDDGTSGAISL